MPERLTLTSVPAGARVCPVGARKLLGKTPLEIDLADAGARGLLLVEHPGYRSQEVKFPARAPIVLRKLGPDDLEDALVCRTQR